MVSRIARGLLVAGALAALGALERGELGWNHSTLPGAVAAWSVPVLASLAVWLALASARDAVAPLRSRIAAAASGVLGTAVVAALLWHVIPRLAAKPDYFPERVVDSASSLVVEAPIAKTMATHQGTPTGWGRLVLLFLGFGVGWLVRARQRGDVRVEWDLDFDRAVRAVGFGVGVMLAVGGLLFEVRASFVQACTVLVVGGLVLAHAREPRSERASIEVARSVLLSAPVAGTLAVGTNILPTIAPGAAPSFVLVPFHVSVMGTLWLVALLGIAAFRLRL
jgi:hypothetical protein